MEYPIDDPVSRPISLKQTTLGRSCVVNCKGSSDFGDIIHHGLDTRIVDVVKEALGKQRDACHSLADSQGWCVQGLGEDSFATFMTDYFKGMERDGYLRTECVQKKASKGQEDMYTTFGRFANPDSS